MSRRLETFHFPPTIRKKLKENGFETKADIAGIGCVELSEELGITRKEALEVLRITRDRTEALGTEPSQSSWSTQSTSTSTSSEPPTKRRKGVSGADLLNEEKNRGYVLTLCQELDAMLGGGVAAGQITEFCGVPGIGKTQLGIQLCLDVQIPKLFNGLEGHAIYIDTEGSFTPTRAAQMATALVGHVNHQLSRKHPIMDKLTMEDMLKNIHVYQIHDFVEQLSCIKSLPSFLKEHPNVRVIVIDSVTFQFRHFELPMTVRTRLLSTMAQDLASIADTYNIAVVLMNQVTTKISNTKDACIVPALGETWAHSSTTRLMLEWEGKQRYARLLKSPSVAEGRVPFGIADRGFTGEITSSGDKRNME